MKAKDMEGQLNLFGSEPYQPKMASADEEKAVELSTEAEEFLSVGRRKKKEEAPAPEAVQEPGPAPAPAEEEAPAKKPAPLKRQKAGGRNVVMQKSFAGADGKVATAAFVDYNLVYVESASGRATLTHYPDSKLAVDRYLAAVEKLSKADGAKATDKHPALKNVSAKEYEEA